MVKHKRQVTWDEEARDYFKDAIAYIKKDSVQTAEKIKNAIIASTKVLADEPENSMLQISTGLITMEATGLTKFMDIGYPILCRMNLFA